ncbi:MAG: methyltransferase domain-containing protein [Alphaproteobacteria bacterium]|nr:methyltransferase domain-containing protein [Alphaproteobacteria bacterium]
MTSNARVSMDRMYRHQRYIYDLTRKYYLFGRDKLIAELPVQANDLICEVGCGTARNLVLLAKRHPNAKFYGVDASAEMLKTARLSIESSSVGHLVKLATALSTDFTSEQFGLARPFDRLIYSYSLSMMDDWREALEYGLTQLRPGGTIHVVDFGDQAGLPGWFKRALKSWLDQFHVRFRPEIRAYFEEQDKAGRGRMTYRPVMRGYAYRLDFVTKI